MPPAVYRPAPALVGDGDGPSVAHAPAQPAGAGRGGEAEGRRLSAAAYLRWMRRTYAESSRTGCPGPARGLRRRGAPRAAQAAAARAAGGGGPAFGPGALVAPFKSHGPQSAYDSDAIVGGPDPKSKGHGPSESHGPGEPGDADPAAAAAAAWRAPAGPTG